MPRKLGAPAAGANEHGAVAAPLQQFGDREDFADDLVGLEPDAEIDQPLHLALDDVAGQAEGGSTSNG